ncbi:MAG: WecB/TagA/CpsF family glycosyltransferase [Bacteroidetes bacterium]|nr:WecB/TagA/CpsF family glycosyltransferase [Bacteroidota bacterium]
MKNIRILNTTLALIDENSILSKINKSIQKREIINLIYCDFRLLLYLQKNSLTLIEHPHTLIYPDSTGVFLILKLFYRPLSGNFEKLVSTDIHYQLLNLFEREEVKIFVIGYNEKTLKKIVVKLQEEKPRIKMVGSINGYKNISVKKIIETINKNDCDILLIGMGVPKQEIFLNELHEKINIPVRLTVGAFFQFYSGLSSRAPIWIRKLNMEWLFRFFNEPFRLFSRYFIEYPKFVVKVIIDKIKLC